MVLKIDEEKNRIALGLKQTTQKPWDTFVETVQVGDDVKGTVEKPADVLEIGQEIDVRVTDINFEDKKISLSMKALQPGGEDESATQEKKREKKPRRKEAAPVEAKPEEENFSMAIGDLINFGDLEAEAEESQDEE